jgi:hypothetical protein
MADNTTPMVNPPNPATASQPTPANLLSGVTPPNPALAFQTTQVAQQAQATSAVNQPSNPVVPPNTIPGQDAPSQDAFLQSSLAASGLTLDDATQDQIAQIQAAGVAQANIAAASNDTFLASTLASNGLTPATATADQVSQIQQAEAAMKAQDPSVTQNLGKDASSPSVSPATPATLQNSSPGQTATTPSKSASSNSSSTSVAQMFFCAKGTFYTVQYPTNCKGYYSVEGLNKFPQDAADDAATKATRSTQNLASAQAPTALQSVLNAGPTSVIPSSIMSATMPPGGPGTVGVLPPNPALAFIGH